MPGFPMARHIVRWKRHVFEVLDEPVKWRIDGVESYGDEEIEKWILGATVRDVTEEVDAKKAPAPPVATPSAATPEPTPPPAHSGKAPVPPPAPAATVARKKPGPKPGFKPKCSNAIDTADVPQEDVTML